MTGTCIRDRQAADVDGCVDALAEAYRTGGYPTNWPAEPARWLTPTGMLRAWVATRSDGGIIGHVLVRDAPATLVTDRGRATAEIGRLFVASGARGAGVAVDLLQHARQWALAQNLHLVLEVAGHLRAAIGLYERTGWRRTRTDLAGWTTPDGEPVPLHLYELPM